MSRGFVVGKDFKEITDTRLNYLEEYFQTRWFFKDALVQVKKAKPQYKCDLVIFNTPGKELIKCKYTSICRPMIHKGIGILGFEDVEQTVYCLHLPRKSEDYKKTWKGIDYVIAEENRKDEKKSILYYIDANKLLTLINQLISEQAIFIEGREIIYHRENLVAGVPMEDLVSIFDIVDMVDEINWAKREVRIVFSKLPVSSHIDIKKPIKFRSIWDPSFTKYWPSFKLRRSADRSKVVIITSLDTGRSFEFPSIVAASRELSQSIGHNISECAIRDVVKGRSKTIITPKGRLTAKFKE